jgi:hypothetical protein
MQVILYASHCDSRIDFGRSCSVRHDNFLKAIVYLMYEKAL